MVTKMNKILMCILTVSLTAAINVSYAKSKVDGLVAKKAAVISKLHKKASKALVNAAQDKSYSTFVAEPEHRNELRDRVDKVSLNVQKHFHVEEMCLIDAQGPELARIVGNEIATDLSPDESGAVFFKPSFAEKPRKAYISPVYMSPDANKWVVAYVTPVMVNGEKQAILHYEHGLQVYQQALAKGIKDGFALIVNRDGWMIADTRTSIKIDKEGTHEDESHYFKKLDFSGKDLKAIITAIDSGGEVTADDGNAYNAAYKVVGNWTIMVFGQ